MVIKMSAMDVVLRIAGGNPGAMTVVMKLLTHKDGGKRVIKLEELGYKRSLIWLIYKDLLGGDITRMEYHIDEGTLGDAIKKKMSESESFHRAWTYHVERDV